MHLSLPSRPRTGEREEEGGETPPLQESSAIPLTHLIPPEVLLQAEGSTIVYERNPALKEKLFAAFSTGHSPSGAALSLKQLLCCLPTVDVPEEIGYQNIFRIIIMKFMDAWDMDIRSVKKTCVHIAHPDGRIIPFDTFNLFYRDHREQELDRIRRPHEAVPLTVGARPV